MLYIAELVLPGQFSVPKEMCLQASKSIVERYGTVWTTTSVSYASGIDVYFGYSGTLSNQDVFGNTLASTNPSYYRSLAASLSNNNYTNYNTSNTCQHEKVSVNGASNNNYNNSKNSENKNADYKIELCSDPNVLRVIYIIKTVITIIKIIIPAIIILMGIISYSRAIMTDNQNLQSVTISFIKKIFIGVLIFFIPTIVTSILSLVNFKIKSFNFNDCYKNANLIKIKDLENKTK